MIKIATTDIETAAAAAPRRARDRSLCSGPKLGARRCQRFSSFRQTRRRSDRPPVPREALRAFADRLQDYPDGAATVLREAIGARHGIDPATHRLRQRLG